MKRILLTGVAGFIGFSLARRLLASGMRVLGVDNLSPYYDVRLKQARLDLLTSSPEFAFEHVDLADSKHAAGLFASAPVDAVVHLAAQPGVRYSIDHPRAYVDSNIVAFLNVLEGCRYSSVKHLVFASSSSVYGGNTKSPFAIEDGVDHPVSLYAATKKANELMAHSYSHVFGLPVTGLRFFTVYGPWGRPDMAPIMFTKAILAGSPIRVFNYGDMKRDFTYIDDVVEVLARIMERPPTGNPYWRYPDPGSSVAPYRLYNVGNSSPVDIMHFIRILEGIIGRSAHIELVPMQPGDVQSTFADVSGLERDFGFVPNTSVEDGLRSLVAWYRTFYGGLGQ